MTRRSPGIDRAQARPTAILSLTVGVDGSTGAAPGASLAGEIDLGANTLIIAAILLLGVAFLVYRWWASRSTAGAAVRTTDVPTAADLGGPDLAHYADALLVVADERARDGVAAEELARAFAIRLRLDDEPPADDAAREALQREIVDRTAAALRTVEGAMVHGATANEAAARPESKTADVESRIRSELAEADRDLRETRTALAELGQLDVGVAGRVREVERAIDRAHDAAREEPHDALEVVRLATEAHRLASRTLLVARDPDAVRDRLASAAESSLWTAETGVAMAAAYLSAHGHGVGPRARASLAEARRRLRSAGDLASDDPTPAIDAATDADRLAREAYRVAVEDVAGWEAGGLGWGQAGRGADGEATVAIIDRLLAR